MVGLIRRDFLNGAAIAITGLLGGLPIAAAGQRAADAVDPTRLAGLRGSQPGSYDVAHALRDGQTFDLDSVPVTENHDLVIVGGGISGLSAAWFYRQQRPDARILILDNHDDFGGHARRNLFEVDGRPLIGYGGTQSIDSPRGSYSEVAMGLLRDLGIEVERFDTAFDQGFYQARDLRGGIFFKHEAYGTDKLVRMPKMDGEVDQDTASFEGLDPLAVRQMIDAFPMSDAARALLFELEMSDRDVLAGQTPEEKRARVSSISYEQFLRQYWGATDEIVNFYQQRLQGMWGGVALDGLSARAAFGSGLPGGRGLALRRGGGEDEPYIYHFPDGNASIARMLVRRLVPGVASGNSMEDIVEAPFDYGRLDMAGNPVRIRLNSTAVRVRNAGGATEVGYVRNGQLVRAKAQHTVLACYNSMIPYLLEDVPDPQAEALRANVKAPLVYINVALRNWRAWQNLGIYWVRNPAGFVSTMTLDYPVSLGGYHFARTPDDPIVAHLMYVPMVAGTGLDLRSQYRLARQKLYALTFGDFEREIRDELGRLLGPGGFVFDRDVAAITVNRWAHGYAYTPDTLTDDMEVHRQRVALARQPVGRVAIANSDAGWDAYTEVAIDEAHRAIHEILEMA